MTIPFPKRLILYFEGVGAYAGEAAKHLMSAGFDPKNVGLELDVDTTNYPPHGLQLMNVAKDRNPAFSTAVDTAFGSFIEAGFGGILMMDSPNRRGTGLALEHAHRAYLKDRTNGGPKREFRVFSQMLAYGDLQKSEQLRVVDGKVQIVHPGFRRNLDPRTKGFTYLKYFMPGNFYPGQLAAYLPPEREQSEAIIQLLQEEYELSLQHDRELIEAVAFDGAEICHYEPFPDESYREKDRETLPRFERIVYRTPFAVPNYSRKTRHLCAEEDLDFFAEIGVLNKIVPYGALDNIETLQELWEKKF